MGSLGHGGKHVGCCCALWVGVLCHLLDALEGVLHALDRHILACLDTLRFEHLGEGPLSFLGDESIFMHFVSLLESCRGAPLSLYLVGGRLSTDCTFSRATLILAAAVTVAICGPAEKRG